MFLEWESKQGSGEPKTSGKYHLGFCPGDCNRNFAKSQASQKVASKNFAE
jgi:hypothetical protein